MERTKINTTDFNKYNTEYNGHTLVATFHESGRIILDIDLDEGDIISGVPNEKFCDKHVNLTLAANLFEGLIRGLDNVQFKFDISKLENLDKERELISKRIENNSLIKECEYDEK